MRRVVIVGPGAAGKSVLATQLGAITGFPVIELDKCFWQPGLSPTSPDQWTAIQRELVEQQSWIMDGDLGPYDVTGVRFEAADTIVFLDFSRLRCACRAIRRSRERADFWRWLWGYRRQSRPLILQAIASHAGRAQVHVLSTPRAVREFVARADRSAPDQQLRLAVPARASRHESARRLAPRRGEASTQMPGDVSRGQGLSGREPARTTAATPA